MERCIWTNEGMEGCYKDAVKKAIHVLNKIYEIAAHPQHIHVHKRCAIEIKEVCTLLRCVRLKCIVYRQGLTLIIQ